MKGHSFRCPHGCRLALVSNRRKKDGQRQLSCPRCGVLVLVAV